mgnify:CR=1 FL=1
MVCLNCEHLAAPGWALCDDCVPVVYGSLGRIFQDNDQSKILKRLPVIQCNRSITV